MGNLGSVLNMLKKIGTPAQLAHTPEELAAATKILLPGVGAFDQAMKRINQNGFKEVLNQKALIEKVPVLGICLGMQLLTQGSEEGILSGLAWLPATTKRFPAIPGLRIPHMGWNQVIPGTPSPLTRDLPEECRFYFVHSFYVQTDFPENSVLKCHYGLEFDAAVQKDNIYGAQFHPEKSHRFGMQFLKNFANL